MTKELVNPKSFHGKVWISPNNSRKSWARPLADLDDADLYFEYRVNDSVSLEKGWSKRRCGKSARESGAGDCP
jgi:hypothetical protein